MVARLCAGCANRFLPGSTRCFRVPERRKVWTGGRCEMTNAFRKGDTLTGARARQIAGPAESKPTKTYEFRPRKRLSRRQECFLRGKLAGKSSRRAALDAGYSPSVAARAN